MMVIAVIEIKLTPGENSQLPVTQMRKDREEQRKPNNETTSPWLKTDAEPRMSTPKCGKAKGLVNATVYRKQSWEKCNKAGFE